MIEIGDIVVDLSDPVVVGCIVAAVVVLVLVIMAMRASAKSARRAEALMGQMGQLSQVVQGLSQGQAQLTGGLDGVAKSQSMTLQTMEMRMADVQQKMAERLHENAMRSSRAMSDMQDRMNDVLHGSSEKTTKSLTQLQERLATIDRAQSNIEKLSGDVLSLQDILSNKQTRGAFGEIQLNDIVSKALPAGSFTLQKTLSNGKRVDCLIDLPNPPGPIAVDAKFPLEAYEKLVAAETKDEQSQALRELGQAVRVHIKKIAESYLIEGETADGALMFLPSEAVYAELHAKLPAIVREGFAARVWIVSPTTCMATLNTMRAILKDARMREQAGQIRIALKQLHRDVELIGEKAGKLETHLRQAGEDVSGVITAATRAGKRADRLESFEFEELSPTDSTVVPLQKPGE